MLARRALCGVALLLCLGSGWPSARTPSVVSLLDRYASGAFDDVLGELQRVDDFEALRKTLERDAPAWIDAAGLADRQRRRLTAATFALEAARTDEWHQWKWIQRQPPMGDGANEFQPLNVLYWKAPPLLIEWGCELFRADTAPTPIERWWQLAALAVAQRSQDAQFLVGDTAIGLGVNAGEIINTQHDIKHLDHIVERFPNEPRFMLGQGIARDRYWDDDATKAYMSLFGDQDVGGEAMMRMGAMQLRRGRVSDALMLFDRAERATRDPYVVHLARLYRGRALERQNRREQATAAYRGAVAAWPGGQAATLSLASLLFQAGRRSEAQELTAAMFAASPMPADPWREYVHADDRFWPLLIRKLREGIRP
jgi:tetratricopeptide (TPR) repeat protein